MCSDALQDRVLQPLARLLYPKAGSQLSLHHAFVVDYSADKDTSLDMHHDNSDVTFNVCLGKQFEGAGLTFCGLLGQPDHRQLSGQYKHIIGRCLVHLGAHRHGADHIVSGRRMNLIVWNENLQFRESNEFRHVRSMLKEGSYQAEEGAPDLLCVSSTHDRDAPNPKDDAWCPPTL